MGINFKIVGMVLFLIFFNLALASIAAFYALNMAWPL
jgi:hypothetical protein